MVNSRLQAAADRAAGALSLSEILDELDQRQDALDKLIIAYFKLEKENRDLRQALQVINERRRLRAVGELFREEEARIYNAAGVH